MCVCVCVCVHARECTRVCVSVLLSIIGFKANNYMKKEEKNHFNMRIKWSTVLFSHRSIMIFPLLRYSSYIEFTIEKKFNF